MTARPEPALRLALVQANATLGDFAGYIDKALAICAAHRDADLIVFPECYLSGYPLEDLVLRQDIQSAIRRHLALLAERIAAEKLPPVLIGTPLTGTNLAFNAA